MLKRKCAKCQETKSVSKFYFNKREKRYKSHCKECHIGGVLESRRSSSRKCEYAECENIHYGLGYCRLHYERVKLTGNPGGPGIYNSTDPNDPRVLRKFGITAEELKEMAKDGCQVCGVKIASFALDHDHKCCNEVPYCGNCTRGYVCQSCNTSIGKYENDTIHPTNPVKDKIISYLVNHDIRLKKKGLL
jgi:Recombination endonuclease VII